jgi:AraC-like DNA-binding protein
MCLLGAAATRHRLTSLWARAAQLCAASRYGRLVCTLSSESRTLELLPTLHREANRTRLRKVLEDAPLLSHEDYGDAAALPFGALSELGRLEAMLKAGDFSAAASWLRQLEFSHRLSLEYLEHVQSLVERCVGQVPAPLERSFSVGEFVSSAVGAICPPQHAGTRPGVEESTEQHGRDRAMVDEVQRFVLSDLILNADMARAAEHVGLSYTYFSTMFKEHAGRSFSEFVREARMSEAERMLKARYPSISEVARRVGYRNAKHFTRAFKQYFGMSPRAYAVVARTQNDG